MFFGAFLFNLSFLAYFFWPIDTNGVWGMFGGIFLICLVNYQQIKKFIKRVFNKLLFYVKRLLEILGEFTSRAYKQLKQLTIAIIDSIVPIIFLLLSLSILSYGLILISCGIVGDWTYILFDYFPWLNNIVRIIGVENTFLGIFKESGRTIWILIGVGFTIVSLVVGLMVFLKKGSLKLNLEIARSKPKATSEDDVEDEYSYKKGDI
jgi:hypothetical protein